MHSRKKVLAIQAGCHAAMSILTILEPRCGDTWLMIQSQDSILLDLAHTYDRLSCNEYAASWWLIEEKGNVGEQEGLASW